MFKMDNFEVKFGDKLCLSNFSLDNDKLYVGVFLKIAAPGLRSITLNLLLLLYKMVVYRIKSYSDAQCNLAA